jgi:hypothetical protein
MGNMALRLRELKPIKYEVKVSLRSSLLSLTNGQVKEV